MFGFIQFFQISTEIGYDRLRPDHVRYHLATQPDTQPPKA
jgi:hypothetical protein